MSLYFFLSAVFFFAGQVLFEVGTEVATAGAAAALTAVKAADKVVDVAKVANRLDDVTDAARALDRTDDAMDAARALDQIEVPKLEIPVKDIDEIIDIKHIDETSIPKEPYNRRKHYGNTPKKTDRDFIGTTSDEVVDHDPPLVQRYYEGDSKTGEKPGHLMTQEERVQSANDRTRMKRQAKTESVRQGAEMSKYSKRKKKELGF